MNFSKSKLSFEVVEAIVIGPSGSIILIQVGGGGFVIGCLKAAKPLKFALLPVNRGLFSLINRNRPCFSER